MTFAMPRKWQNRQSVDQGIELPRTVYYQGEVYANVNDLRHVINFRIRKVNDNRYRVAMLWMKDLLKQLLEEDTND